MQATALRASALVARAAKESPAPGSPLGILRSLATMSRGQYRRLADAWADRFLPREVQEAVAASAARRLASAERAEVFARAGAIPEWRPFETALGMITDRAAMRADPEFDPRWEWGKPNEYVNGGNAGRMALLALLLSDADVGRDVRLDLWEACGTVFGETLTF